MVYVNNEEMRMRMAARGAHMCHWPGCIRTVQPKMWGCPPHWFTLPKALRDRVWAAYVPGQEIRKDPSKEYLTVAADIQKWIKERKVTD